MRVAPGRFAVLDDEDAERVGKYKWSLVPGYSTDYAKSYDRRVGNDAFQPLHRFILHPPMDVAVDHINGNGLDNRRCNLRLATPSENGQNRFNIRPESADKTSRFKGVHWSGSQSAWLAGITLNGQRQYLGRFQDEIEAGLAYDAAALELFGRFARTNEMMGLYPGQMPTAAERRTIFTEGEILQVPKDPRPPWDRPKKQSEWKVQQKLRRQQREIVEKYAAMGGKFDMDYVKPKRIKG